MSRPPAFALRIVHEKTTTDPLALRYAAHFGLGLFVPAD